MSENNKKTNIIYAIIAVMTLMITITGATFAYYTATASNNATITGNMATVTFNLSVTKKTTVDETKGGLIPMTNSMVQKALTANASDNTKGICVDDNGNAVCQVYKITVQNTGTASMFVDGYVTLTGGSGNPTDDPTSPTTMRWAQVFCGETNNKLTSCTTAGTATARQTNTSGFTWTALGANAESQNDAAEIKTTMTGANGVTSPATISGNTYPVIKTNYIRISKHTNGATYAQATDVTSALVYNQYLAPNDSNAGNNTGDSNTTYADAQVYYIVVWLTETGTNQTAGSTAPNVATSTLAFFQGNVTFTTSQGSEVTSTFSGYSSVAPDTIS